MRGKYLAWVGMLSLKKHLRHIGWTSKQNPEWISDGNIPDYWRSRLLGQIERNDRPL